MAGEPLGYEALAAMLPALGSEPGSWLDELFDLGRHTGRLLPLATIEQLDELLRTIQGVDRERLRRYIDELVTRKDALSATDQNALSRLMTIERRLDEVIP